MGLFDYVRCEAPLPDGKPTPPDLFQTKDFPDPYMERYTITAEGRLVKHRATDDDLNWHGWLCFGHYDTKTKEHRRFRAKFTDGQLVEIVQVKEDDDA